MSSSISNKNSNAVLSESTETIHPTAIISPGAEIAPDVKIGPYCTIGSNVKIAEGCELTSHVVIDGNTEIGTNNRIFPFASLGFPPQDLKFGGEDSKLTIGSGNMIREYVTVQPGTAHGRMETVVGDNNLLMACSHVGHDCIVGDNNVLANSAALAGHVYIGSNCILGGLAGIHQFAYIGDYAFIGAGAMVAQDIPPFLIVQGDRATLRGVNAIGLQRAGFSQEEISEIKLAYRKLFISPGAFKKKLEEVLEGAKANGLENKKHLSNFLEFVRRSAAKEVKAARGLCPAKKSSNAES